jgi:hypothetical protein
MYPYRDDDNALILHVEAKTISKDMIRYECPCCVYRKKTVIHLHGSCGDLSNRVEGRVSHCNEMHMKRGERYISVRIHITDNTVRI